GGGRGWLAQLDRTSKRGLVDLVAPRRIAEFGDLRGGLPRFGTGAPLRPGAPRTVPVRPLRGAPALVPYHRRPIARPRLADQPGEQSRRAIGVLALHREDVFALTKIGRSQRLGHVLKQRRFPIVVPSDLLAIDINGHRVVATSVQPRFGEERPHLESFAEEY